MGWVLFQNMCLNKLEFALAFTVLMDLGKAQCIISEPTFINKDLEYYLLSPSINKHFIDEKR